MTKSALAVVAAVAALAISIASTMPARALSMSECSAKYKAAKDAGTLNGMKWNDFRKAQCGAEATAAPAPAATPSSSAPVTNPLKPLAPRVPLPPQVPRHFRTLFRRNTRANLAGKQRMHTCSTNTMRTKQMAAMAV